MAVFAAPLSSCEKPRQASYSLGTCSSTWTCLRRSLATATAAAGSAFSCAATPERRDSVLSESTGTGSYDAWVGAPLSGTKVDAGVFLSARILSKHAFDDLPESDVFEDLSDWFLPRLQAGHRDIEGQLLETPECLWEPVGTPDEYLHTNLRPPDLSYLPASEMRRRSGTRTVGDVVVGVGARIPETARLERCVVWENENVPENLEGVDGVFACGTFYPSSNAAN